MPNIILRGCICIFTGSDSQHRKYLMPRPMGVCPLRALIVLYRMLSIFIQDEKGNA